MQTYNNTFLKTKFTVEGFCILLPDEIWFVILSRLLFNNSKTLLFVSKFFNTLFYQSVLFIPKTFIKRILSGDKLK